MALPSSYLLEDFTSFSNQRQATGRKVNKRDIYAMSEPYLRDKLSQEYTAASRDKDRSLEEKRIDSSIALNEKTFLQNIEDNKAARLLQEKQAKAQGRSAAITGATTIASTGLTAASLAPAGTFVTPVVTNAAGTVVAGGTPTAFGATTGAVGGSAAAGYAIGRVASAQSGSRNPRVGNEGEVGYQEGASTKDEQEGGWAGGIGGAAAGVGIGAAVGGPFAPVTAAVGGVVGFVVGYVAGSGESVICSELNRQGYLSDNVLELDCIYGKEHISKDVYIGYRLMADPIVRLMKKSKIFTQIVRPFGVAFAHETASRVNTEIKGSVLGKVILRLGVPLCRWVFKRAIKQSVKRRALWAS